MRLFRDFMGLVRLFPFNLSACLPRPLNRERNSDIFRQLTFPHSQCDFPALLIFQVEKPGGEGAGIGTFQDSEGAAGIASGAAYAAGVEQEDAVHVCTMRDMEMAKKCRFRSGAQGNGGQDLAAFFYTVMVAMRQKKPAGGFFCGVFGGNVQFFGGMNGLLIVYVAADSMPREGKACAGGCLSQVRITVPQENGRIKREIAHAALRPFEYRFQVCDVAVRIRNNQKKGAV